MAKFGEQIATQSMQLYPWLTNCYQQLVAQYSRGQAHHSLLFQAEQGLGVEQLNQQFAHWLLCQQPQQAPCLQCHSCHLVQAQHHPDLHLLASIEGKDISVEQVRDINEKVIQYAQQDGNKVVIIQGVEKLTEAAANALLKTLEEPRPHTYFLLQADIAYPVMPTIYSRCQVHSVLPPTTDVAMAWLQQHSQKEIGQIRTALRINYGRPLVTLDFLSQDLLEKRRTFLRQFWLFYKRKSPLELLPYFENELVFQQLDWLYSFLTDALKEKLQITQDWICMDFAQGVRQFNQQQTPNQLLKALQLLQKVRSDLQQINGVNQELILLAALCHLITDIFEE